MKRSLGLFVCALALLGIPSVAHAGGDLNFLYGTRYLNHGYWAPDDYQRVYGATFDFGGGRWPVNLAIGYYESDDSSTIPAVPAGSADFDVHIHEYSFGVEKVIKAGPAVRPFFGGGISFVTAESDVTSVLGSVRDSSDTNGFYFHGGVFFRLGPSFNIGFDGRFLGGTHVTLFNQHGDADYWQFGGILGFGW
jgi:hypothetical protein